MRTSIDVWAWCVHVRALAYTPRLFRFRQVSVTCVYASIYRCICARVNISLHPKP